MPVYDYLCERCGAFSEMRPMAECDAPSPCPRCGRDAPRAFLTAPYLAAMPVERRVAHATNERSAHAPSALSRMKPSHGSGCSCCSGRSLRAGKRGRESAKNFPGRRPWMISH